MQGYKMQNVISSKYYLLRENRREMFICSVQWSIRESWDSDTKTVKYFWITERWVLILTIQSIYIYAYEV